MRPCRSALSIGGLLKHATYGMRGAIARLTGEAGAAPRDRCGRVRGATGRASPWATTRRRPTCSPVRRGARRLPRRRGRDRSRRADRRAAGPVVRHLRRPARARPLLPRPPDRGAGPPRRPRRHHPGADRRHGGAGDRAQRGRRAGQRLLPALRARARARSAARAADDCGPANCRLSWSRRPPGRADCGRTARTAAPSAARRPPCRSRALREREAVVRAGVPLDTGVGADRLEVGGEPVDHLRRRVRVVLGAGEVQLAFAWWAMSAAEPSPNRRTP